MRQQDRFSVLLGGELIGVTEVDRGRDDGDRQGRRI
jgi:hypothetical protein